MSRVRKARPSRSREGGASKATSVCPATGKSTFITRKDARHARRLMGKPGAELNAYRCDACHYWHLGHLPDVVQNGDVARADLTRRPDHVHGRACPDPICTETTRGVRDA